MTAQRNRRTAKQRRVAARDPMEAAELGAAFALEHLPIVLPAGWMMVEELPDGRKYINPLLQLIVIVSGAVYQDGRRWMHLSVSHVARIPRWEELVEVKETFLGQERYAYQVIPARSNYVNIHPRVLHLWTCLDGDPLPDFTFGTGQL